MPHFDPEIGSPANLYKLMIGVVVPRPIAFVSSLGAEGTRNLAPFVALRIPEPATASIWFAQMKPAHCGCLCRRATVD